jgi:hypothetical protein
LKEWQLSIRKENGSSNNNTFQIVYLDASNAYSIEDIIKFAMNLTQSENVRYDRIQLYTLQTKYLSSVIEQLGLDRSELFFCSKEKSRQEIKRCEFRDEIICRTGASKNQ